MGWKEKSGECYHGGRRGYNVIINVCVLNHVLVHVPLQLSKENSALQISRRMTRDQTSPPQHLKLILKGTGPIASVFGSVHYSEDIRLTRLPVCLVFAGFRFDGQAEMWCFLMLKILRAVFGCLFWQYDASLV